MTSRPPACLISDSLQDEKQKESETTKGAYARFEPRNLKTPAETAFFPAHPLDFTPRVWQKWKNRLSYSLSKEIVSCMIPFGALLALRRGRSGVLWWCRYNSPQCCIPEWPVWAESMQEFPNSGFPMSEIPESGFTMSEIPGSVFQMSEIPGSVFRKIGLSGIGYVRFRKLLLLVWKQRTFGLNDPKVQ